MGRKRTNMAVQLARALAAGRSEAKVPTRADILAALLRKRCIAANAGLAELEMQIRSQILWALPIERPAPDDEPCFDPAAGPEEGAGRSGAAECGR